jgi:predicted DNA-binding antitoxin AbrB/MazE fold protein
MRPVEARFEDGVLKPTERLDLRPGERVRLLVLRRSDPSRWDMKRLASASNEDVEFASAGLDTWADALDAEDRR